MRAYGPKTENLTSNAEGPGKQLHLAQELEHIPQGNPYRNTHNIDITRSMAAVGRPLSRSPFQGDPHRYHSHNHHDHAQTHGQVKSIPILPSAAAPHSDAMEVSQPQNASNAPTAPMGPPTIRSPKDERPPEQPPQHAHSDQHLQPPHQSANGSGGQPVGAAAAAQQPKVVQTAFIHKLYKYV